MDSLDVFFSHLKKISINPKPIEPLKKCTGCGKFKPISQFNKSSNTKDKHSYRCKDCQRTKGMKYRSTPSGIYTTLSQGQRFFNKKPVTITRSQFIKWYHSQEKVCVYCGIKEEDISLVSGSYIDVTERLTIDCKVNEVGYKLGNIVLACHRCNFVKSNIFTFEEMCEIGQKFIKPKWVSQLKNRRSLLTPSEEVST